MQILIQRELLSQRMYSTIRPFRKLGAKAKKVIPGTYFERQMQIGRMHLLFNINKILCKFHI
jgi:hypothetical protein